MGEGFRQAHYQAQDQAGCPTIERGSRLPRACASQEQGKRETRAEQPGEGHVPGGSRNIPETAGGKALCAGGEALAERRRDRRAETLHARLRTSFIFLNNWKPRKIS